MSCLKRRDEAEVPSTLFESISTGRVLAAFDVGKPWMLPMKAVKLRLANGPVAATPIAMLLLAVIVSFWGLWRGETVFCAGGGMGHGSPPPPPLSEAGGIVSSAPSP